MLYKTHLVFSFLVYLIVIYFIDLESKYIFFFILVLSSFIPDIDIQTSKIGRKFKKISFLSNKIFSHRGFFHSIFFPSLFYFIFTFILNLKEISLAIFLGISSHLFLDLWTKEGISLLSPFSQKRINGFIKTGGISEKILFFILLVILFTILFFNFL